MREVAKKIGIDTPLPGKIERNKRQSAKEQIKQVAIFYKLDKRDLLKEYLSGQIAYKIVEEEADIDTFKSLQLATGVSQIVAGRCFHRPQQRNGKRQFGIHP